MEEVLPRAVRTFTERLAQQSWNSPSHRILRHSRLFSLPPQLARPDSGENNTQRIASSNTATLAHPIHQAIETTSDGLRRGDWGLKRSLPLKSTTATSNPVIRINGIDSPDDVTDFESAADHYLTREKWQEMNIPMTLPNGDDDAKFGLSFFTSASKDVSAFEERLQATTKEDEEEGGLGGRWKYGGPWLAGMQPGDFENYVTKSIRGRRSEFDAFAKVWLSKRRSQKNKRNALDQGMAGQDPQGSEPQTLSDEEFRSEITRIRSDRTRKELTSMIWEFLDLPGKPPHERAKPSTSSFSQSFDDYTATPEGGPPTTHPSAGLSYLRTANIIPNHPTLGPMRQPPPVEARVLQLPRRRKNELTLGVGGVATTIPTAARLRASKDPLDNQEVSFEPEIDGGAKVWTRPKTASIDSKGRIILKVDRAESDALAVWEHQIDKQHAASKRSEMDPLPIEATLEARRQRISNSRKRDEYRARA